MSQIDLHIHGPIHVHVDNPGVAELKELLTQIKTNTEKIIMTQAEMDSKLDEIDVATTAIGVNVTAMGATATVIDNEVKALLANPAGIPQATIDKLTKIGAGTAALKNASDALVPVLNAIAAEGAAAPVVPVPVPAPISIP